MKRPSRFWLMSICAVACLLGGTHQFHTRPVSAQTSSNSYDDGNVYVYAYVDVDSNYNLYAQSYAELDPEADDDIDYVDDEIQVDQDGSVFYDEDADPDPELSEYGLESTSPVASGFEYGVTSIGYVCIDDGDGDGDCDWYSDDSTYASVSVSAPPPQTFPTDPCAVTSDPKAGFSSIVSTGTTSTGTVAISFSGAAFAAISPKVTYGPYSTPSSIASNIAALISKNYLQYGLSARSFGPSIIYGGTAALGTVGVTSGSSFTGNTSPTAATAAATACYAIPSIPCLGLWPDYDTKRLYTQEGITETPRQHIIRRHILGTPTLGPPPITVYANTVGATPDELFSIVQQYNFKTVLLGTKAGAGGLSYTFPSTTIGGVTYGLIGKDGAGNDLYTNFFVLSPDRCSAITSYPVAP
jgi:hypothetical protein